MTLEGREGKNISSRTLPSSHKYTCEILLRGGDGRTDNRKGETEGRVGQRVGEKNGQEEG